MTESSAEGPFDVRNELEDALAAAAEDPAARGPFLRLLLDSTVYVIGQVVDQDGNPRGGEGKLDVQPGEGLSLRTVALPDERSGVPFFSSVRWLSGCLKEPATYLSIPTRMLFQTAVGATFLLNPGAPWGKEFSPEEVTRLLESGGTGREVEVDAPREVRLGLPSVEPTALLAALTTVFTRHPEVSEAFLGMIQYTDDESGPHLIVGLDGDGDLVEAIRDAGAAANGILGRGEMADFARIKRGDEGISDFLTSNGQRFYGK